MSADMNALIRRAAGRAEPRRTRDARGRFTVDAPSGGLAGGAGRGLGGTQPPQTDMNELLRALSGRGPWPTFTATNGIRFER